MPKYHKPNKIRRDARLRRAASVRPFSRFIILSLVLLLMMGVLVNGLYALTIKEGAEYSSQAQQEAVSVITLRGKRGTIYDCNGLVLAYDETCYNVEFLRDGNNRSDYFSAVYTESLLEAIKIIEENGGTTIDTSYIRMDENGEFYYDWGSQNEKTITSRYRNFCNACGFSIPKNSDGTEKPISEWITAEEAYLKLRKSWFIPSSLPYEDAVKVISIRQEVLLNDYKSYEPIVIAYDVSMSTVAQLEMKKLEGITTAKSTTRVYPYGMTAAHVLGYCQGLTEDNYEEYIAKGYSRDDKIGVSGIEATMEQYLTGSSSEHHGRIELKTNANKSIIEYISNIPPTDGCDVALTMNLQLQIVTEAALEDIIASINAKQQEKIDPDGDGVYSDEYAEYENIKTAKTGAIVVMDVNSGNILAMASYPSFDPNWFVSGLTPEQAEYLYTGDEAADTTPTRNKAISMKLAPGSIFKMCTGFAGLMEGATTLDETISDESPYYLRDPETGELILSNPVKCWTTRPDRHADQTVVEALTNSCNYYFCEIANRLGIDKLKYWAEQLGLADYTGVELTGETKGIIGGQTALYDNTKLHDQQATSLPILVFNKLCDMLEGYQQERGVEPEREAIESCADKLMQLQDGSLIGKGAAIRKILSEELGIPDGITRTKGWVTEITSLLNELQWRSSLTIRTGIGQSILLVTPIAAVRYASAIANGGTVYDAHIVASVTDSEGNVVYKTQPTIHNSIDAPEEYWDAIRRGMAGVVSPEDGGTASSSFSEEFAEMGYLEKLCGKTGSAQVGNITIDIQNTSWFVAFAPNDNPDIAICVCIPNGLSGSSSAGAIEDILTYYFKELDAQVPEDLIDKDGILP
ncbi:MAG: hypothetical protein MR684_01280 [Clostridium sp.]|nr:hypothetical protein [Clostridium sp.]